MKSENLSKTRMGESGAKDTKVRKSILAFIKKMDATDSDDALLKTAIANQWLDANGCPTSSGRELAKSFEQLNAAELFD